MNSEKDSDLSTQSQAEIKDTTLNMNKRGDRCSSGSGEMQQLDEYKYNYYVCDWFRLLRDLRLAIVVTTSAKTFL